MVKVKQMAVLLQDLDCDPVLVSAGATAGCVVRHTHGWHYFYRHADCTDIRGIGPYPTQAEAARALRRHLAQCMYDEDDPIMSFRHLFMQVERDAHERWVRFQMRYRALARGSACLYDMRMHGLATGDPRVVPTAWEADLIGQVDRCLAELMEKAG